MISLNTQAILGYIQGSDCRNDDLIIELYQKILDNYLFASNPCFVHSDMEEAYHTEKVQQFLSKQNIYISVSKGAKNQNQVSEAVNNRIKQLVAQIMLSESPSRDARVFHRGLPDNLRFIHKKSHRYQSADYRKHLFQSKWFKNRRKDVILEAILQYNKADFSKGITR